MIQMPRQASYCVYHKMRWKSSVQGTASSKHLHYICRLHNRGVCLIQVKEFVWRLDHVFCFRCPTLHPGVQRLPINADIWLRYMCWRLRSTMLRPFKRINIEVCWAERLSAEHLQAMINMTIQSLRVLFCVVIVISRMKMLSDPFLWNELGRRETKALRSGITY